LATNDSSSAQQEQKQRSFLKTKQTKRLNSNDDDDDTDPVFNYSFTEDEASTTRSFLNDLVYLKEYNAIVITDSGISTNSSEELKPALLVVDLNTNDVNRLLDSYPSTDYVRSCFFSLCLKKWR